MTIRPIMIMTIIICINNKQTTPGAHKDAGWGKRSRVSWQVRSRTISPNWWEKGGNNHGFQLRFSQQNQIILLSNWFVVPWWVKESVPLVTAQGWHSQLKMQDPLERLRARSTAASSTTPEAFMAEVILESEMVGPANFESNYPTVFSQLPRYPRVLPPA